MYKNYKILSLVVARKGSKGLKNKNIKNFLGKPLVSWSILASKKSRYVDYTLVSTDSNRIIKIAKSQGVNAPFKRPQKLAGDSALIKDVIFHAVRWLKKNERLKFNFLLLLQASSPLRTHKHIDKSIKYYFSNSKDKKETMISVTAVPKRTGWLLQAKNKYAYPMMKTKKRILKRQNLGNYFLPNGAIYFCNLKEFSGSFHVKKTLYFEMSKEVSEDIDDINDFKRSLRYKRKKID